MTTQQPGFSMSQYASSKDLFAAMIARITELESQLAQRFDAADMATAAAQGFRDGVASLTAQAADRAIEGCPELNMGNYDEVGVERLNDWAIRANDEIDRLHALAAGQATAAQAGVPPNAITASIMRDDGGEAPAFCLMASYRSEKDARDAFALIAAAPARDLAAVIKGAADKLDAAVRCHPNAVDTLIHEALEILDGDREPDATPASRGQTPAGAAPTVPEGFQLVKLELLREARDNCRASIAEDGISGMRKEYRIDLEARLTSAVAAHTPTPQADSVTVAVGSTGKNLLQVQAWVIPDGNGGGQFSWQKQDERFWMRLTPPAQAADSVLEDAARYRLVRRGQHWSVIDGIGNDLRAEALDAAIDAARAAQKEGE